jgi:hypothetical protein
LRTYRRGKRVVVNGESLEPGAAGQLPPGGEEMLVTLTDDKPITPTDWLQSAQTLAGQEAEWINIESRLHLSGATGSGVSAVATLPTGSTEIEAVGPDLRPLQITQASFGKKNIALSWNTVGILNRDVTIRYRIPSAEPGREWEIAPPQFGAMRKSESLTVINPLPGTAISGGEEIQTSTIDQLPYWMQSKLPQGTYSVARSDPPILVKTRVLPRLAADTARISEALFSTRLVADGSMRCEAVITVQ